MESFVKTIGKEVYWYGSTLRKVCFQWTNFRWVDFHGTDFRWGGFSRADFRWADFSRVDLCGADLCNIDLRWANLCRANLCGVDLGGTDLHGANLYRANLRRVNLCRANFSRANLHGANLCGTTLMYARFNNTILTNTVLDPNAKIIPLSDEILRAHGFEYNNEYVYGYRTKQSTNCGDTTYAPGEVYEAPVFSVCTETTCHPGIYLAPLRWIKKNYLGHSLVRCKCLRTEMIQAVDKFRAKRLWVLEDVR